MNNEPDSTPEKRIPMRAQADNKPPPRMMNRAAKLEYWRSQLREALQRVIPEPISEREAEGSVALRDGSWVTLTGAEHTIFQEVDFLIRDDRVLNLRGPVNRGSQGAVYSIYKHQPASEREIALWRQAVAARAIVERFTGLMGDINSAISHAEPKDKP